MHYNNPGSQPKKTLTNRVSPFISIKKVNTNFLNSQLTFNTYKLKKSSLLIPFNKIGKAIIKYNTKHDSMEHRWILQTRRRHPTNNC